MEEVLKRAPAGAHGTYYRAAACTDDCPVCAPVRKRIHDTANKKAAGRRAAPIVAEHGTWTRAAACTNDCEACRPVRINIASRERAKRQRRALSSEQVQRRQMGEPRRADLNYEGADEYRKHLEELFS